MREILNKDLNSESCGHDANMLGVLSNLIKTYNDFEWRLLVHCKKVILYLQRFMYLLGHTLL